MSDQASHQLSALETAWSRFATYDHNAKLVQSRYFRLRTAMLAVGVAATTLAIVYVKLVEDTTKRPDVTDWWFYIWLPMISMPILGSVLAAGSSKLSRGVDWVNLRGAAETIKREIYRYRCKVGAYGEETDSRDATLAEAVGQATARLMDTAVINASLKPYRGSQLPPKYGASEHDDGFSDLAPAQYLDWRLGDQLIYFRGKSRALDRRHRRFQWWNAVLGGAGTLLAALGQQIWVPVSVSIATALISYLELRNVETNLAGYNRAALELDNVITWWGGLQDSSKADPANFTTLIDRTETILGSENASWLQEMQEAVARAQEKEKDSK